MMRTYRTLIVVVAAIGLLAFADVSLAAKGGKGKQNHHNGQQLLGEKIKTNGHHVIDKKGDYTTSVEVKNGKIAGVHVSHAKKGDIPVKKYKTNKKMARMDGSQTERQLIPVQDEYLGTIYIGYAYIDDYGFEEIYWFPYDMILDGDTGAIEYVPVTHSLPPADLRSVPA